MKLALPRGKVDQIAFCSETTIMDQWIDLTDGTDEGTFTDSHGNTLDDINFFAGVELKIFVEHNVFTKI